MATKSQFLTVLQAHAKKQANKHSIPDYPEPTEWLNKCLPALKYVHYQGELLTDLSTVGKISARGPRGLGKTTIIAAGILWFAATREAAGTDWKIVVTSGSHYQLREYLWPEVHKWARRIDWGAAKLRPWGPDDLQKQGIKLRYGNAATSSPERPELIEGAHADEILVVLDEAKSIPSTTFDAIDGMFTGATENNNRGYSICVSTPGAPAGRFYDIHSQKKGHTDWKARHVTIDEAIAAGRVTQHWADTMLEKYGEDDPFYTQQVLGDFMADDLNSLIPHAWVIAANERWENTKPVGPVTHLGVDVARHGKDETVIGSRHGMYVNEFELEPSKQDTHTTATRIAEHLRKYPYATAVIDSDGMGVGVYDMLNSEGLNVEPFFGAPKPTHWRDSTGIREAYNTRTAAWWNLRELLEPPNATICLPPDEKLLADLTAPKLVATLNGQLRLEKKEQTKKRIGRSPDRGDCCVYLCWEGSSVDWSSPATPDTLLWEAP